METDRTESTSVIKDMLSSPRCILAALSRAIVERTSFGLLPSLVGTAILAVQHDIAAAHVDRQECLPTIPSASRAFARMPGIGMIANCP